MHAQQLPNISDLTDVYTMPLTHLGVISLSGEERVKYLQGQVTCDVASLPEKRLLNGAHCSAKGKVHSTFRLYSREDSLMLLQSQAATEASIAELKKFGVFSKVNIESAEDFTIHGFGGSGVQTLLKAHFTQLPDTLTPVISENGQDLIYLSGLTSRYLLITPKEITPAILASTELTHYPSAVWDLLEISNGIPTLQNNSIGEYVPQMLNIQAINGISFTKGCYLGQETVARMQYLGKNKRALYCLTGQSNEKLPHVLAVEKQLGEHWRKAGDIIHQYQSENGDFYLQAVLANDIEDTTALRVKGHESMTLHIAQLPYSLATQD